MPAPDRKAQRTSNSYFDPLTIQPPPNETEEEKAARLEVQKEAIRVSRTIDAGLAESKRALERKKHAVKILLLGQSESGKSSISGCNSHRNTSKRELFVWKTVIQLNLISSIKKILTVLQDEWESAGEAQSPTTPDSASPDAKPSTPLTSDHRRLSLSLSPLLVFETSISQIMDGTTGGYMVTVRPGDGCKHKLASSGRPPSTTLEAQSPEDDDDGAGANASNDPSHVAQVLAECKNEIIALWEDRVVRRVLEAHGVYLQEESGFFLDDTSRIAALDYVPSDRDIMRAQIRTIGVEEHRFVTESGFRAGTEFYITEVCGNSNRRSTWVPYFDDVQAIIFLAPLTFWQTLEKDNQKVNSVQDSLELWREIAGNPLFAKAALILVFNKKDLLQAHINAGVMVKDYVPSFGIRSNDVVSVTKYFRDKFCAYHRKFSPEPRPFIFYETEAIDTKSTAIILGEVQKQTN
ncbi:G-protein alpha subunit [Mycena venus]|uniref:G-protein alpha subunit n=1 Tax=Mycena venus TaxID=2733690 RepID=A0A8H6XZI4_9AGAR|nr:G-protein alpha subunit [Mycena venus]